MVRARVRGGFYVDKYLRATKDSDHTHSSCRCVPTRRIVTRLLTGVSGTFLREGRYPVKGVIGKAVGAIKWFYTRERMT